MALSDHLIKAVTKKSALMGIRASVPSRKRCSVDLLSRLCLYCTLELRSPSVTLMADWIKWGITSGSPQVKAICILLSKACN